MSNLVKCGCGFEVPVVWSYLMKSKEVEEHITKVKTCIKGVKECIKGVIKVPFLKFFFSAAEVKTLKRSVLPTQNPSLSFAANHEPPSDTEHLVFPRLEPNKPHT